MFTGVIEGSFSTIIANLVADVYSFTKTLLLFELWSSLDVPKEN
jgi:hypothetical protein